MKDKNNKNMKKNPHQPMPKYWQIFDNYLWVVGVIVILLLKSKL